jgi:cell division protein FtsB
MTAPREMLFLLRKAAAPALALLVIANFAGYALFGSNGLLALTDYHDRIALKQKELVIVQRERANLANQVRLLNPTNVDPDYADELVRKKTGQVRKDEFIMPVE